jgi:hypothetical protein
VQLSNDYLLHLNVNYKSSLLLGGFSQVRLERNLQIYKIKYFYVRRGLEEWLSDLDGRFVIG